MTAARRIIRAAILSLSFAAGAAVALSAQGPPAAPESAYQRYAPIDLTGTWVSIVTEDWAERMIVPPKGDFASLPLTRAAQDAANRANMADVEASGRACDAYGAPVAMREPGRVRISWQDASTLRIETDAGEQTRLLHFGGSPVPGTQPTRQGYSVAEWQYAEGFDPRRAGPAAALPARAQGRGAPPSTPMGGRLKVVTTNLTAGFLRKNGVPYSADTTMTEYYNLLTEPNGGPQWFVVTTIVHDPENLVVDYITSTNFRKEPDGSKWRPRPCSVR